MTALAGATIVRECRICAGPLMPVLSLGSTPLANAFVRPEWIDEPEPQYPLRVVRCADCQLVQLDVVVDAELMFREYAYTTSASPPMRQHFEQVARDLVARAKARGKLVVEIGSNDGVLLAPLAREGARPLGIEPAHNQADVARERGLETWSEFFGPSVAERIVETKGRAALVIANNVLAHMADLRSVARALAALLDDDALFVAEVPYLIDMLDGVEYDTIYHEHLSYYHLAPLQRLFASADLEVVDVERLSTHGGSIRIFVGHAGRHRRSERIQQLLTDERARGLANGEPYERFAEQVDASRAALLQLLGDERTRGARVAAYGASAKGNTLLNFCRIGADALLYVADTTPYKQGTLTPGMRVPVVAEGALDSDPPDLLLLLAWNYADQILPRLRDRFRGRFIHPIPVAHIIE